MLQTSFLAAVITGYGNDNLRGLENDADQDQEEEEEEEEGRRDASFMIDS